MSNCPKCGESLSKSLSHDLSEFGVEKDVDMYKRLTAFILYLHPTSEVHSLAYTLEKFRRCMEQPMDSVESGMHPVLRDQFKSFFEAQCESTERN